ncbi:MAG TPA: sensor histidine kinase [Acidimicrobiia bacterium]|nr:sensor histidine kinase [Acidimicrobiia bacterium]
MNDTTAGILKSERLDPGRSGFSRWAPLVFFAFILTGPIFSPDSDPQDWVLAVGVVAVALPTFVVSELRGWDVGGAAVLMVLALATAPFDSTAIMALPIYAAALVAGSASKATLRLRLSVITLLTLTGLFLSSIPWPFRIFILIPVIMTWVIGSAVFHDVSRDHRAVALQAENRRVAHLATIAERERLARDVHDIAGQALTAIIVRSQLVKRLAPSDQGRATEEADKVERIARDALSSIRESVAGWHQASLLDELAVAGDALAAAGTELKTFGDWDVDLAPSVENVLALGLREAVTNVLRHANARTVVARLDSQDGGVSVTVTDDGIGPSKGTGSGIQGMRDRVIAAGGTLRFGPGVTGGTELRIDMPFGGSSS